MTDTNADLQRVFDWTKMTYEETWRQYIHEDNLVQTRSNLFLAVQGALLTGVTVAVGLLASFRLTVLGRDIWVGLAIGAILIFVLAIVSLFLLRFWKKATKGGQQYVNMRRETASAIEKHFGADISPFDIAFAEIRFRGSGGNAGGGKVQIELFPALKEKSPKIEQYSDYGSSAFIRHTAIALQVVWVVFLVLGILLLLAACALSLL
jgi:hypothetical protein